MLCDFWYVNGDCFDSLFAKALLHYRNPAAIISNYDHLCKHHGLHITQFNLSPKYKLWSSWLKNMMYPGKKPSWSLVYYLLIKCLSINILLLFGETSYWSATRMQKQWSTLVIKIGHKSKKDNEMLLLCCNVKSFPLEVKNKLTFYNILILAPS